MTYPKIESEKVLFRELFTNVASVTKNQGVITSVPVISKGATFDGTDDKITYPSLNNSVKTISITLTADSTTEEIIDLDGGTHSIEVSGGTITATGFSSPTIYVNGVTSSTLTTAKSTITVTTATAVDVTAPVIGAVGATFYQGDIHKVSLYKEELSASEVLDEFNDTTFTELRWLVDLPLLTNYVDGSSDTVTANRGSNGLTVKYGDGTTSSQFPTQLTHRKGITLDGTTDHMEQTADASLTIGAKITLVTSFKVNDTSGQDQLLFRGQNGSAGAVLRYYAYVDTGGKMTFGSKVSSGATFSFMQATAGAIRPGATHCVVCTTDSSASGNDRIRIWIDGIEDTTAITWNGEFASDVQPLFIGQDEDVGLPFAGQIYTWKLGGFTVTDTQAKEITRREQKMLMSLK